MASVISSLMYSVAVVALLVAILECCCRSHLKRLRGSSQLVAVNIVNSSGPYYPPLSTASMYPVGGPGVGRAPAPPYYTEPYPPLPPAAVPTIPIHQQIDEAPPPSYEQVMANERYGGVQTASNVHGTATAGKLIV